MPVRTLDTRRSWLLDHRRRTATRPGRPLPTTPATPPNDDEGRAPMRVVRTALVASLAVVALAAIPVPALAATVGCTWDIATRTVTVTMAGHGLATIENVGGSIEVEGSPCFGPTLAFATVEGTKRIGVNGDAADQDFIIALDGGRFAPGYGDEPGNSDEIEFRIHLGGGSDSVGIAASDKADRIRVGSSNGDVLVNLNAAEAKGIDADVRADALAKVAVHGGLGDDVISGAGGAATGGALVAPMIVEGGGGDDRIVGGSAGDDLYDNTEAADDDVIYGRGGDDAVSLVDADDRDAAYGGNGTDACSIDTFDTKESC